MPDIDLEPHEPKNKPPSLWSALFYAVPMGIALVWMRDHDAFAPLLNGIAALWGGGG